MENDWTKAKTTAISEIEASATVEDVFHAVRALNRAVTDEIIRLEALGEPSEALNGWANSVVHIAKLANRGHDLEDIKARLTSFIRGQK